MALATGPTEEEEELDLMGPKRIELENMKRDNR